MSLFLCSTYCWRALNHTVCMQSKPMPQVDALKQRQNIGHTYSPTVRDMDKVHDPPLRTERRQGKTHPSLSSRIGHLRRALLMQDTCNASHEPRTYENVRRKRACTLSMYLSCAAAALAAAEVLQSVLQHTARLSYIVRSLFS